MIAQIFATLLVVCCLSFGLAVWLDIPRRLGEEVVNPTVLLFGSIGIFGGGFSLLVLVVALIWGV